MHALCDGPRCEGQLAALCEALGARDAGPLSAQEADLLAGATTVPGALVGTARAAIRDGQDPLGAWFCRLRSPAARRLAGATYTPTAMVAAMVAWAEAQLSPACVVDPGAGSGRFLVAAGRRFPAARLVAVDLDPLAALMARANLVQAGLHHRAEVRLADYRSFTPPRGEGPTLFIGNPPYVRHHHIDRTWKRWLTLTAARHNLLASQRAGLHVHFFVATLEHARAGDLGAFVTASEWLDVSYGALVRDLLAGKLGMERMDVLDPSAEPFAGAQSTAVITCFRVGSASRSVLVRRVRAVADLAPLAGGHRVARDRLAGARRWSHLHRARRRDTDLVELGQLCRVHRGQVTGANRVWIAGDGTPSLPARVLRAAITRARELFATGGVLSSDRQLRRIVDLPRDLDELSAAERHRVGVFLAWAKEAGAHESYIARHRTPWWAVRLRAPAPILATYMARRPPAFVRNLARACHINIAHGLYPRDPLPDRCLDVLAAYLAGSVRTTEGRTYAGGLTKFEPGEMERLRVPTPEVLAQMAAGAGIAKEAVNDRR